MTDDKPRQTAAPGDDTAQLEGQTMLEGFAPEPEPEADQDAPPQGYRRMTPEEKEKLKRILNDNFDKVDRYMEALKTFYESFYLPGQRGLEQLGISGKAAPPAAEQADPAATPETDILFTVAGVSVKKDFISREMIESAVSETMQTLKKTEAAIADGLPAIRNLLESGLTFPDDISRILTTASENTDIILAGLRGALSQWAGYSAEDMQRIIAEIGDKARERLANLSPEELAELERELEAEQGETVGAVIEEAAIEVLQSGNIRQGTANNTLTKIKPTKRNTKVDPITHTATITHGDMVVTIPNWDKLTGLKTTAYQLLDACTTALTNTGWKRPQVAIRLSDYMQLRGLKDEKEARKQVNADLETLFNARISFKEKRRGKNTQNYADMRICDFKGIENGVIHFSFGSTFFELMKSYTIMPVQPQLFKLNSKRNPNSYYLLRRLMEHKNMNVGKLNEDIISVKTLLEACKEGIPSYEEVMAGNKHVTERIIDPFERDMNALEDTLTWEYCHSNGAPLADTELERLDYTTFSELLILTHWKNYPDQTARMERKQARIEEAKAKKKRGRKPKKPPAE